VRLLGKVSTEEITPQNPYAFGRPHGLFLLDIRKETNRRTFNHEFKSVEEVAFLIKEDGQQYDIAVHKLVHIPSAS
jgi:hypothetical protein